MDEAIEYDLDSEDEKWLTEVNKKRKKGVDYITEDDFERIIDNLEKQAFIRECERSIPPPEDIDNENTNCSICGDGTSDDTNQIVFCDGCDIAVHQGWETFFFIFHVANQKNIKECYGIRCIPEGLWFCSRCEAKNEKVVNIHSLFLCIPLF